MGETDLDTAELIGTTLADRYYVKRGVAVRSIGPVVAAHDLQEDREVCLKVLRRAHVADERTIKRFEREARLISSLDHPNVVDFYGFGVTQTGDLYIAMELVPGKTLEYYLEHIVFDLELSLYVMVDLLTALDAAHQVGVVHRDIKHANIALVTETEGRPAAKLLDFGIAVLRRDPELQSMSSASGITQTGAIVGTPGFMAPEILTSQPYDGRADLYGVGVVWWELLARRRLFRGPPMPTLVKHITEPAPTLTSVGVEVPRAYEELILSLLEKDPDKRPESARATLRAIAALDYKQDARTSTKLGELIEDTIVEDNSELVSALRAPTTELIDGLPRERLLHDPVEDS